MKIGITLPVYLSDELLLDFTKQTLESIKSMDHSIDVCIVVNYSKPEFYPKREMFDLDGCIDNFEVVDNPRGNEVGAAWNWGIKKLLDAGCEYVMVMNNDLVLHYKCIDNLVMFAQDHPELILWTASEWIDIKTIGGIKEAQLSQDFNEHPHFSYFMVTQKTMDTVGWFDENLKMAYMEDGDFHYRILLSGNKAGKTESAKFYHYGSRTIKIDDELFNQNKKSYEDNRNYIWSKWHIDFHGKVFVPPEEMLKVGYKTPFNNPNKGWKDW